MAENYQIQNSELSKLAVFDLPETMKLISRKTERQRNYEISTLCVAHCEVTFQEGQQTQNSIFNQLYSVLLG